MSAGNTSTSTSSKKRKHSTLAAPPQASGSGSGSGSSGGKTLIFSVSEDASKEDGLRPLLASTPSIPLPPDTTLFLYEKQAKGSSKDGGKKHKKSKKHDRLPSMLHGESAKLDWNSSNRLFGLAGELDGRVERRGDEEDVMLRDNDDNNEDDGAGECFASYALAIYDPSTGSVSAIPAPLHILSHVPKRLKSLPSLVSSGGLPGQNNAAARAELGLSFGTKKSIRAIRAAERNKVDAGAKDLQDLKDVVMENLDAGLETLASSQTVHKIGEKLGLEGDEAVQAALAESAVETARAAGRPIPHMEASRPEDVYPLIDGVILQKEFDAINPTYILRLSAEEKTKAITMLPYKKSIWVNDRLKEAVSSTSNKGAQKKRTVKVLQWMSALMQLKTQRGSLNPDNEEQMKKVFGGNIYSECTSSLLDRFAEGLRGTKNRSVTPAGESRILSHIMVAALHLESFSNLDHERLANDLGMAPKKLVEILKTLGARIITPRGTEADKIVAGWKNLGRNTESSSSGKLRVASLLLPLEFPKEKRGKAPTKR